MSKTITSLQCEAFEYDGERDLDEVICSIVWCVEDLLVAMHRSGIEVTDENVDRVLDGRFERTLRERSIEEGWEVIDALIGVPEQQSCGESR